MTVKAIFNYSVLGSRGFKTFITFESPIMFSARFWQLNDKTVEGLWPNLVGRWAPADI